MKLANNLKIFALSATALLLTSAVSAKAETVSFGSGATDFVTAATTAGDGPTVTASDFTFTGGYLLNGTDYFGLGTPVPGYSAVDAAFYNYAAPQGAAVESSLIKGASTGTYNSLSVDVIQGTGAGPDSFTLTGYTAGGTQISSDTGSMAGYNGITTVAGALASNVEDLTVSGPGIAYFTVTEDPTVQGGGFAIDNITATPEPSSVLGMGVGAILMAGMAIVARRKAARNGAAS